MACDSRVVQCGKDSSLRAVYSILLSLDAGSVSSRRPRRCLQGPRGIEAIRFMAGFRIRINQAKALNKVFVFCPDGCVHGASCCMPDLRNCCAVKFSLARARQNEKLVLNMTRVSQPTAGRSPFIAHFSGESELIAANHFYCIGPVSK